MKNTIDTTKPATRQKTEHRLNLTGIYQALEIHHSIALHDVHLVETLSAFNQNVCRT